MRVRFAHVTTLAVFLGTTAVAQAQMKPVRGTATATINGKTVTIEYGRPGLKGRTLNDMFSKLPQDRVWRAGDNQVTTLTTETDLLVGGKKIPAGKYSLYVQIPENGDWSLLVNTDLGIALVKLYAQAPPDVAQAPWPRLDGYQRNIADKEVAKTPLKGATVASPVDLFTIGLAPSKDGAILTLSWGDRAYSTELKAAK